ncbi:YwgA family protein [Jeotgalibacillus sp. S-D1]|uniref:YwgA family protein n=1 Tax=Jeotgalibacillus sp. S-D1 TaxID=2552189 RepID=UPI001059C907|nr:YwgA family protein [Jeotgalibacillus sp. S-D1]TDL32999.1 YwgA family protein [Jeotgalibacillus sp. S-D1]
MMKDHAKLMQAFFVSGEIVGRKKLQKMIYIAKKLSFPFHEKYQFHFFGPYSEELTLRVEELCNMGFITEQKEKKSGYTQYRYGITEEGQAFLDAQSTNPMPSVEACLRDLNDQSSRFLELVSTMLYFDGLQEKELIQKVQKVKSKQNYTEEEISEALAYIKHLSTVS